MSVKKQCETCVRCYIFGTAIPAYYCKVMVQETAPNGKIETVHKLVRCDSRNLNGNCAEYTVSIYSFMKRRIQDVKAFLARRF